MADCSSAKCPVCGGDAWQTALNGPEFRIDICAARCIGRTVPPPVYSSDLSPEDRLEDLRQSVPAESGHFMFAKRVLDLAGRFRPSGILLDIGSGLGHLLKSASDRGYDAIGLEAAPGAVALAREAFGVESIVGVFPQRSFEPESFDVVVLNHVMEHLDDPRSAVVEIERILKPGGILAVCVPDFSGLMRRIKGVAWQGLQPDQHVWQLTGRSVCKLTESAGLDTLVVQRSDLDYRRGNGSLPKWLALRAMLALAGLLRMGDMVTIIARKPSDRS